MESHGRARVSEVLFKFSMRGVQFSFACYNGIGADILGMDKTILT